MRSVVVIIVTLSSDDFTSRNFDIAPARLRDGWCGFSAWILPYSSPRPNDEYLFLLSNMSGNRIGGAVSAMRTTDMCLKNKEGDGTGRMSRRPSAYCPG